LGFYLLDKKASLIFLSIYVTAIFILSKYFLYNIEHSQTYEALERIHYYPSVFASLAVISSAIAVFKQDTNEYQMDLLEQQKLLDSQVNELSEKDKFNKSLIRELNHRVKNNIQLISGLITLQTYSTNNQEVVSTLQEARNRLDSIMILHQHLYQRDLTIEPNIAEYIQALLHYIAQSSNLEEVADMDVEIENMELPINLSVHIGLIINELIINVAKYGFQENKRLKIAVS
jgi:two-component sensor histidine kinase